MTVALRPSLLTYVLYHIIITLMVYMPFTPSCMCVAAINRQAVLSRHNPSRNSTISVAAPLQVGNGGFAFGADITGMHTFQPFNIMSDWGWKNDTPVPPNITAYHGYPILSHGEEILYEIPDPNLPDVSAFLFGNANRMNLGRVGLSFSRNVTEEELVNANQTLDLWSGVLNSSFVIDTIPVTVLTYADPYEDTVSFNISSALLLSGGLGFFLDFPYCDTRNQFQAPYVGFYNLPDHHTTVLTVLSPSSFTIQHSLDLATYFTTVVCTSPCSVWRPNPDTHYYQVTPIIKSSESFAFSVLYSPQAKSNPPHMPDEVLLSSHNYWAHYWSSGGFIDFSASKDPRWMELERRVVLSQYHMAVNEAGNTPPQESGLVNNGWFGKFHMEMYFWHSAHWALWNQWDILDRSSSIYDRFLDSSMQRAKVQKTLGARWPKMTDPSGHPSPFITNAVLIWQQPHPIFFAELEYHSKPTNETLHKWGDVVQATADWMASWAYYNVTSTYFDLGTPIAPMSENTDPSVTRNTAFELTYWHVGLQYASTWMTRLGRPVPPLWLNVQKNLAPLPVQNGEYVIYEGIENMWTTPGYVSQHPSMAGMYGWLPATPGLDLDIVRATLQHIKTAWKMDTFWGWDFPLLAMQEARLGNYDSAVNWILDPSFVFDDIGMPTGGIWVPTPYFPSSGGLLYAVAFMAAGWDGSTGHTPGFGPDWDLQVEGINPAL